jgi:uncharacterized protein (TIGR03435 family)
MTKRLNASQNQRQGRNGMLWVAVAGTAITLFVLTMSPTQGASSPQSASDAPAFETVTIKSSNRPVGRRFGMQGRQFYIYNATLDAIIAHGYGVHVRQIVGGPDWMDKVKFDIRGTVDAPRELSEEQWNMVLQNLAAERFQFTFHHETKELPVYLLSVLERGAKLTRNDSGQPLPTLLYRTVPGGVSLPGVNATTTDLANSLQKAVLDRPVVDKTGLDGRYNFLLTWTPDPSQFAGSYRRAPSPKNNFPPPDLFAALQEQLGLKLQPANTDLDVLVVEHVERPVED